MSSQDWMRLAWFVRSRRLSPELRIPTQDELSRIAGVNKKTVNTLERGQVVSSNTLTKVERALRWSPGSADAILNGGEPTDIDAPADPVLTDPTERELWNLTGLDRSTRLELIKHLRETRRSEAG